MEGRKSRKESRKSSCYSHQQRFEHDELSDDRRSDNPIACAAEPSSNDKSTSYSAASFITINDATAFFAYAASSGTEKH